MSPKPRGRPRRGLSGSRTGKKQWLFCSLLLTKYFFPDMSTIKGSCTPIVIKFVWKLWVLEQNACNRCEKSWFFAFNHTCKLVCCGKTIDWILIKISMFFSTTFAKFSPIFIKFWPLVWRWWYSKKKFLLDPPPKKKT